MLLSGLIDSHNECVSRLILAIQNDSAPEIIDGLDSRIKLFAGSVRDIHLSSPLDINQQIKFFLNRSQSLGDDALTSEDRNTVELLIDRYTNQPNSGRGIGRNDPIVDTQALVNLRDKRFFTDQLIVQSNSRISLYNLDYQYEYTSTGNARFHDTDQASFVGKHVADIVGDRRFKERAKRYYDRCFSGEHLHYSYFLDVADKGERLMDCQLTPYRDSDGSVRGAFFAVEDITDRMERATQSAISNAVN
ncbi:MAG: PAS domain-containing protein [Rhizobiaceae bacterium]